jgi:hypothetical protein
MSAGPDLLVPPARRSRLVALVVYAAAMGWLEAVVVVYIRGLIGIARTEGIPATDEMMRRLTSLPWLLGTEQTREMATLVMLAGVGWLAADRWLPRFGAFLVAFGVWDIVYYAALYALIGWPPTLGTMDVLFLIPPHALWYQPVWLPVAISCGLIAVGLRMLSDRAPGLT